MSAPVYGLAYFALYLFLALITMTVIGYWTSRPPKQVDEPKPFLDEWTDDLRTRPIFSSEPRQLYNVDEDPRSARVGATEAIPATEVGPMSAAQLALPVCTCTPGKRCQQCAERGRAHLRMYRLCGLYKSGADPIAYADQVTSLNDARATFKQDDLDDGLVRLVPAPDPFEDFAAEVGG